MARRRSDIAGLAALAALGYGLYNSKKKEEEARKKPAAAETRSSEPTITSDMRKRAEEEGGRLSPGEMAAMSGPAIRPEEPAPSPVKTSTPRPQPKKPAAKPEPRRSQQAATAPVAQPPAPAPAASRSPSREELISQIPSHIPTGGMPTVAGETVEPMSDTERNIRNILGATGVGGAALGGYKIKKILDARKAAQNKAAQLAAQKRADLKKQAEEGIEKNLASEFQDLAASAAATQRADKTLNPNAWLAGPKGMADEFKRGGKVSSKPAKPAAKGWGKARGARQAKYY